MHNKRMIRAILLAGSLFLLCLVAVFSRYKDPDQCMGVPFLSHEEALCYRQQEQSADSAVILHNGEPAATDLETGTIYISQPITDSTTAKDLQGVLSVQQANSSLFFVRDSAFENMSEAVRQGYGFPLLLVDETGACSEYTVVFTTLPVLRLDGTLHHVNEQGRDVLDGSMCLWTPCDPDTGEYSVKSTQLQWHVRGSAAAAQVKKPWKLSLKKSNGENRDLSFLGLGADDDWILNSLFFDDTKVREKLLMELWNSYAQQTDWNYPMSSGEYVEVVTNGIYDGLYLLQRRVDVKYLSLSEKAVLLKGQDYTAETVNAAYELEYSPLSQEQTWALMDSVFSCTDFSGINKDNLLDTDLFLQFSTAHDNFGIRNMYHVWEWTSDGYTHHMIPWDTDMSFGLVAIQGRGFVFDYGKHADTTHRRETDAMLAIDNTLNSELSARWAQLRADALADEKVFACLDNCIFQINNSGAYARDQQRWGNHYGEIDTVEDLHAFIEARLLWLDDYYSQN